MQESWKIGRRIAALRRFASKSLRQLSELTVAHDPERKGVLPAQISRIELGTAVCDLRELHLLALALNTPVETLLASRAAPWFLIRGNAMRSHLAEVAAGKKIVERHGSAHKAMIDSHVYAYLPLIDDPALVNEEERGGATSPCLVKKYLFQVGRCDEEKMVLDSHEGEEIIWVLEGELEFWTMQQVETDAVSRLLLHPGDCLHYSSALRHGFRATGDSEFARALFVLTLPPIPSAQEIVLKPALPHEEVRN